MEEFHDNVSLELNDYLKQSQPRLPSSPKPSLASAKGFIKHGKSLQFNPYKSTRPNLLQEIDDQVALGLKRLKNSNSSSSNKLKLDIYREAFQRFIDDFNIYKPFLNTVKHTYDLYISELSDDLKSYASVDAEIVAKDQSNQAKVLETELNCEAKVTRLNESITTLEAKILTLQKEYKVSEQDNRKLRDINNVLRKESDELRGTCTTLTNALSRLEEERRRSQTLEMATQSEISSLKNAEAKGREEINRLMIFVQSLQQLQTNMISTDSIASLQQELNVVRMEHEALTEIHRKLLIRYFSVKMVIDSAFKNYLLKPHTGVGQVNTNLEELLTEYTSTLHHVDGADNPADKVMKIIQSGVEPKLFIESFLDQFELNFLKSNRNLKPTSILSNTMNKTIPKELIGRDVWFRKIIPKKLQVDGDGQDDLVDDLDTDLKENNYRPVFIDGLGIDDQVPSYLRWMGKVKNVFLTKQELLPMLYDIMESKLLYDETLPSKVATLSNSNNYPEDNSNSQTPGQIITSGHNSRPSSSAHGTTTPHNRNKAKRLSTESQSDLNPLQLSLTPGVMTVPPSTITTPKMTSHHSTRGTSPRSHHNNNHHHHPNHHHHSQSNMSAEMLEAALNEQVNQVNVGPVDSSMAAFFHFFLQDKFHNESQAIEKAYNIVEGLKTFSAISECKLFSFILDGKLPIALWKDHFASVQNLLHELRKDNGINSMTLEFNSSWTINPDSFMKTVRKVIGSRPNGQNWIIKLQKALSYDVKKRQLIHPEVLLRVDEPNQINDRSHFLEQFQLFLISDYVIFENDVISCIEDLKLETNPTGTGTEETLNTMEVAVGRFREAILKADPDYQRSDVNQLLARGCGVSIKDMLLLEAKKSAIVSIDLFCSRIRGGLIKRSSTLPKKLK